MTTRAYSRFVVDKEVECIFDGARDFVSLYNLSCGGCMIETRCDSAVEGCPVEVKLGEMGSFRGRIVWRYEKNAGVKFEVPLHQKAVEFFGFSASEENFDSHDPRDRFGIPLVGNLPMSAGRRE